MDEDPAWPTVLLGLGLAGTVVMTVVAAVRRPGRLERLHFLGYLAVGALLVSGTNFVADFVMSLEFIGDIDGQWTAAQVVGWGVWGILHLVAGGFLLLRRGWWALVLGLGVSVLGIIVGLSNAGAWVLTWFSYDDATRPFTSFAGILQSSLALVGQYVMLTALLVFHRFDLVRITAASVETRLGTRLRAGATAGVLAGIGFAVVGWVMGQIGEVPQIEAHLIGALVAVPVGAWIGYRFVGRALPAVNRRWLAARLALEGAIVGSAPAAIGFFVYFWLTGPVDLAGLLRFLPFTVLGGFLLAVPGAFAVAFGLAMAWLRMVDTPEFRRYVVDPGVGMSDVKAAWNKGRSI